MTDAYATDISTFDWLLGVIRRYHLKQIAEPVGLSITRKKGLWYFSNKAGRSVSPREFHRLTQQDSQVRRWVYNLYMSYDKGGIA